MAKLDIHLEIWYDAREYDVHEAFNAALDAYDQRRTWASRKHEYDAGIRTYYSGIPERRGLCYYEIILQGVDGKRNCAIPVQILSESVKYARGVIRWDIWRIRSGDEDRENGVLITSDAMMPVAEWANKYREERFGGIRDHISPYRR